MLLKIAENIIWRNVFEQKKKNPRLSANQALEQLRPLASTWDKPYDTLSIQNLFIFILSLNRGIAVRNPYVQNMP